MSQSILIKLIIIVGAILFCCFVIILVIRSILEYVIYSSQKNYQKIKSKVAKLNPNKPKKFDKFDEELYRKKHQIPKAHSQVKAENILKNRESEYQILNEEFIEEEKIVGVAKPLGFWTKKIFGERIATVIAQVESMKKGESTKFWQNFVKASRAQTRYRNDNNQMR